MTTTGIEPSFFGSIADTISISFSKGLGAPVGSMMLSSNGFVKQARRMRKMWGGGMRQTGLLAAAARYAVDHHLVLLEDDHRRAKKFAEVISKHHLFNIDPVIVETNIVLFEVKSGNVDSVLRQFGEKGVLMVPFGGKLIRATFHFQITDEDLEKVLKIIASL
jgi:threonine aldolase